MILLISISYKRGFVMTASANLTPSPKKPESPVEKSNVAPDNDVVEQAQADPNAPSKAPFQQELDDIEDAKPNDLDSKYENQNNVIPISSSIKQPSLTKLSNDFIYTYYTKLTREQAYRTLDDNHPDIQLNGPSHRAALKATYNEYIKDIFVKTDAERKDNNNKENNIKAKQEAIALALYHASSIEDTGIESKEMSEDLFNELMECLNSEYEKERNKLALKSHDRDAVVDLLFTPFAEFDKQLTPVKEKLRLCLSRDPNDEIDHTKYNRKETRALVSFLGSLYDLKNNCSPINVAVANKRAMNAPGGIPWKRYLLDIVAFIAITAIAAVILYYTAPVALTVAAVFTLFGEAAGASVPLTGILHRGFFKPRHWGDSTNAKTVNHYEKHKQPIAKGHSNGTDSSGLKLLNYGVDAFSGLNTAPKSSAMKSSTKV